MKTWTIGIMCYNESGNIARVLQDVYAVVPALSAEHEVLVVDDGSADDSVEIVHKLKESLYPNLRIIDQKVNQGIGATLRAIYTNAKMDLVVAVPGDGQFDMKELLQIPQPGDREILNFYRVENTSYSIFRNGLSWINQKLNRWFLRFDLPDVNWILVFPSKEIQRLSLSIQSSLVGSEICGKLSVQGFHFRTLKSHYLPRIAGKSRGASFKIVFNAASEMLKLIWVITVFRYRNKR